MGSAADALPLEKLLEHADWVKGLAHRLVADAARADDLVQETWLRALERPPRHAGNVRGWLGRVVTHLAQSGGRSDSRRARRERDAARHDALPPTDELVAEAAQSRELVDVLLALAEPYRSVLLLRYFRDLPPARIARELDRPVATVKTQLQRGLALMREKLDERYGGRRAWCVALLPLARAGAPAGGLAAKALLPAAAVLFVALAGWGVARLLAPEERAPVHLASAAASVEEQTAPEPSHATDTTPGRSPIAEREALPAQDEPAQDEEPAPADAPGFLLRGRLVDLEGQGIPGVELEWTDPGALRWADAAHTVISGESTWVRVPHEEQRELRADPAALERFARERFRRPELAVALLSGAAPPRFAVRTGAGGLFELRVPERGHQLEAQDGEWSILGSSRLRDDDFEAWFAVRPRTVVGRVLDALGEPVADVEVVAHGAYPDAVTPLLKLGRGFASEGRSARTDAEGRFRMAEVGLSARFSLEVERDTGESVWQRVEVQDEPVFQERVEVELCLSPPDPEPLRVRGRVLLPDGEPAARATVVLGESVATTGSDGEYLLELRGLEGDLYAARAGLGIAVELAPGTAWELSLGEVSGPDLRLSERSLALAGRVLDRDGRALAGAELRLASGDGVDLPEVTYSLEDLAAGRTPGVVRTDEQGRFRLDGLLPRDYGLVVRHADRDHASPTRYAAGTVGIELVVDG